MENNHTCFICRDDSEILYKICTCVDSTICDECYNNKSTHKMDNCGICRKKYEYNSKSNTIEFIKLLFKYLIKYIFVGSIELFPILYIYYDTSYSTYNDIFLVYGIFCITILNIINYKLITIIIINQETLESFVSLYNSLKSIYIIILFLIIIYIDLINKIFLFSVFELGAVYILPLIFLSTIIISEYTKNSIKYINDKAKNKNKEIKILGIINKPINI